VRANHREAGVGEGHSSEGHEDVEIGLHYANKLICMPGPHARTHSLQTLSVDIDSRLMITHTQHVHAKQVVVGSKPGLCASAPFLRSRKIVSFFCAWKSV
jgi:hypothetical protein